MEAINKWNKIRGSYLCNKATISKEQAGYLDSSKWKADKTVAKTGQRRRMQAETNPCKISPCKVNNLQEHKTNK